MKSILNQIGIKTPLSSISPLSSTYVKAKKVASVGLILTPLVDAFAILVIYLLIQNSAGTAKENTNIGIKLPDAERVSAIENSFVINIKDGYYYLENKRVSSNQVILSMRKYKDLLKRSKKKPVITIFADKSTSYRLINPIMEWSSQAGINQIQFAVIKRRVS